MPDYTEFKKKIQACELRRPKPAQKNNPRERSPQNLPLPDSSPSPLSEFSRRFCVKAIFCFLFFCQSAIGQTAAEREQKIRAALDNKELAVAVAELQAFRQADAKIFELNNYDYLLARLGEKSGDLAAAAANYQRVVKRDSILREYALWHLSQIMRANGNLMAERLFLQQLLTVAPGSLVAGAADRRIAQSYFESDDYAAAIQDLKFKIQNFNEPETTKTKDQRPKTEDRERSVLLAEALQKNGQRHEARGIFTNLIAKLPNPAQPDDFALAAARGLDLLDGAEAEDFGKQAPQLPESEHLRRALIYQFNRDFPAARLHYKAIAERYPAGANKPDALLQLGRIANLENKFDEAIPFFARVQIEFPAHPAARDALSFEASSYARLGNANEAISHYEKFIKDYVDNPAEQIENAERPFLNIVDALRDAGRDEAALDWIKKTRQRFAGQLPAALALFSEARIYLAQGNWNQALRALSELENAADAGGGRTPGGTTGTEIRFLKAFCLEQLDRLDEAFNAYLAIPDGRNEYYGWRATERLKRLETDPKTRSFMAARLNLFRQTARQAIAANDFERARAAAQNALRLTADPEARREMLDIARRAYAALPAYNNAPNADSIRFGRQKLLTEKPVAKNQNSHGALADELLFLNLPDEAAPELDAALRASSKFKVQSSTSEIDGENPKSKIQNPKSKIDRPAFTLAVLYLRGDAAHKAVQFAEPLWRNVPADYLPELAPRESVELLYPAPYADSLLNHAAPRGVDPRFVLSIMRQESRFQADVKSSAAARGLMQFISTTARDIAEDLNQLSFRQNDLYDPPTAILFGSQYLANLFRQFPNQPQAVAASYNGGETNMLRWLLRSRSTDADRYVAEIQFAQSKDYVFKVLSNYRVYQTLYDEQLRRR